MQGDTPGDFIRYLFVQSVVKNPTPEIRLSQAKPKRHAGVIWNSRRRRKGVGSAYPMFPVAGFPVQGHHGKYPDAIRFIHINDCKGEIPRQAPARGRIVFSKTIWRCDDSSDYALDFFVKTNAQDGAASLGVVHRSVGVFRIGLGVECVWLHRPTMRRILAEVSSPGMSVTAPLRISSRRR